MNKKRVLFIMPSMFIGGAERSLLGLLNAFDYDRYDVSLFLYRHEGEFLSLIPEQVTILPPMKEYGTFDVPIKSLLFSSRWPFALARLFSKVGKRIHSQRSKERPGVWMSMQYTSRFLLPLLPDIPGEYDAGVSFLGVPNVLASKVRAKKKIAWNHTDYTVLGPDKVYDLSVYRQMDRVISVSEQCTKQFLSVYPQLKERAETIGNILSEKLLRTQAEQSVPDFQPVPGEIRLLSVGRYSEAKNFDNVPAICRAIRESGLNVKWYLIGYGGDEELIRRRIADTGMEEYVIILGKRDNPYPYIKACDLYVQPSRYEGKCVSVIEAQILQKPVVITAYPTSACQLEDGVDGVIVPLDNAGCAKGITDLLRDEPRMAMLKKNCARRDYSNVKEIEKLYELV